MRNDILEQAKAIRNSMNTVTANLTDEQALEVIELYMPWVVGEAVAVGDMRRDKGKLYRCRQAHTTQADWPPELTPALWAVINETHAGTIDDPIPAERGMEYEYGKYYLDPEDGKIYLCQYGDATGTVILQYLPHELIGIYFSGGI